jgi:hypothetical protein
MIVWAIIGSMYLITGITALTTYILCGNKEEYKDEYKDEYKEKYNNDNNIQQEEYYVDYVPPSEAYIISPLYYYTFDDEEFTPLNI